MVSGVLIEGSKSMGRDVTCVCVYICMIRCA